MHTAGGRVSIVINGIRYSARGEVTLSRSGVSVAVGTNQDGTLYKTVAPKPKTAKCTFDRFIDANGRKLAFDTNLMLQDNLAATFVEQDTGVTHMLTKGTFVGEITDNLANGEADGVEFAAEEHRTI